MGLVVEHVFLKGAEQIALLYRIGRVQHTLIEIDLVPIFVISVILGEDWARQIFLDVEHRVDDALTIALEGDVETAVAHRLEPWTDRHDALRDVESDLAPLVYEPGADIFEGLVEITVQTARKRAPRPRPLSIGAAPQPATSRCPARTRGCSRALPGSPPAAIREKQCRPRCARRRFWPAPSLHSNDRR